MERPVPQRPLAVLAYGSLLHSPGALGPLITDVVPCRTPFPVEYGRASRRWNGGPVLVPHPRGGPVDGALLLLADGVELGTAVELQHDVDSIPRAPVFFTLDYPRLKHALEAAGYRVEEPAT